MYYVIDCDGQGWVLQDKHTDPPVWTDPQGNRQQQMERSLAVACRELCWAIQELNPEENLEQIDLRTRLADLYTTGPDGSVSIRQMKF